MTRIIAGQAKGLRLHVPTRGTRPTTDRVREAIFSSVEGWLERNQLTWPDVDVVDLFAGSGALGFEAWSRGARHVTLVDSASAACRTMEGNQKHLGADSVVIVCQSVDRWMSSGQPLGAVCFLDPPYDLANDTVQALTTRLGERMSAGEQALIVAERDARAPNPFGTTFADVRDREYGDTRIWYGHVDASSKES